MAFNVHHVDPLEWRLLRAVRLRALSDAPYAFGSTYEEELAWDEEVWRRSAERLAWFVALEGDQPAGVTAVLPPDSDRPEQREVISTWVAPGHRGTEVGKALLRAAREWARGDGATVLTLSVAEGNERAQRFYERFGFSPTGARRPLRSNPTVSAAELCLRLVGARLRFAPSPMGDLHVGHIRVAILTWILARQHDGSYFVRFENTDRAKEVPGSRQAIVGDLEWLGLLGDERPHDQADMTDSYGSAVQQLSSTGHIYRDAGAVRFRTPPQGAVEWDDLVRGKIVVRNEDLDDPVLVRSDGTPTFYLASSIDDMEDGITHLLRSEPFHRPTAVQMHIWDALGERPPRVGHVPLVTGPRHARVRVGCSDDFSIRALRAGGISPTPLLMYLAKPEIASSKTRPGRLDEILEGIEFSRIPRRPMTFDLGALEALNRRWARARRDHPAPGRGMMVDPIFAEPRLAEIYDPLDPDRPDLDAYVAMVEEFGVRSVVDVGCGTGTLACRLASRGVQVTALDPAAAALRVAKRKPGADRVRWIEGEASALQAVGVEMATLTGNVAQVFLTDEAWGATLAAVRAALRPCGRLVFETRDPARQAWQGWIRVETFRRVQIPGVGAIQTWAELIDVCLPLVSFRQAFVFEMDGAVVVSDSTLRFRDRDEIAESLRCAGFVIEGVRDAPDRPDLEFVFVARRPQITAE